MDYIQTYCNNFDQSDAKLAFFLEYVQYVMLNSVCKGAAVQLKNFRSNSQLSVLYTGKNSFIYNTLNELLEKVVPAGIPQYLVNYHEANLYGKYESFVRYGPTVLTYEDLAHGFMVWLGACGVSFIGFLLELIWFHAVEYFRKLLGLWILVTFLVKKERFL